jgi:hypothetical protein
MATRFSTVYKQELKNKGVLSSMGSAVLKSAKERMNVRNIFFGGKGMLSATGQKIFGRGYSPLSTGNTGAVSNSQVAAQTAATNDLLSSSERQEALLRVVAKNTFNMNMMARDMNITRQNIATLTRLAAGQAAQSQDALWYDVKTRNQAIDSLGRKKESGTKPTQKKEGTSILGTLSSIIGSIASFGGSLITGTLGIIARVSPILGIVALLAGSYVIKEMSKNIDFGAIKNKIYEFMGLDANSEEPILRQWAKKLDEKFETKKFTDFFDNAEKIIIKNFAPQINAVGKAIATASDIVITYTKAAFATLGESFMGIGKGIGFLFNEFFQNNRKTILAAVAAGIGAIAGPKGAAAAMSVVLTADLFADKQKTRQQLQEEIDTKTTKYEKEETSINELIANDRSPGKTISRNNTMLRRQAQNNLRIEIEALQAELDRQNEELRNALNPNVSNIFREKLKEYTPSGGFGSSWKDIIPESQTGSELKPTQLKQYSSMNAMSFEEFRNRVAGGEGGAAGYDAIYGFSQAGGDPRIKQQTGKNLSELTIGEVLAIANERHKAGKNKGAVGRYGLLPSTLENNLKRAGLTKSDIFNAQNQDKLFKAVYDGMVEGLKGQGFKNITNDLIRLAWSVGPKGAKDLVEALKNNPNMPVWRAAGLPEFSDELGPDGQKKPSGARLTNPHLENTVEDYLKGRILSQGSVNMNDGRMELASALPGVNVFNSPTTNNNVQSGGAPQSSIVAGVRDMNALELFVSSAISIPT